MREELPGISRLSKLLILGGLILVLILGFTYFKYGKNLVKNNTKTLISSDQQINLKPQGNCLGPGLPCSKMFDGDESTYDVVWGVGWADSIHLVIPVSLDEDGNLNNGVAKKVTKIKIKAAPITNGSNFGYTPGSTLPDANPPVDIEMGCYPYAGNQPFECDDGQIWKTSFATDNVLNTYTPQSGSVDMSMLQINISQISGGIVGIYTFAFFEVQVFTSGENATPTPTPTITTTITPTSTVTSAPTVIPPSGGTPTVVPTEETPTPTATITPTVTTVTGGGGGTGAGGDTGDNTTSGTTVTNPNRNTREVVMNMDHINTTFHPDKSQTQTGDYPLSIDDVSTIDVSAAYAMVTDGSIYTSDGDSVSYTVTLTPNIGDSFVLKKGSLTVNADVIAGHNDPVTLQYVPPQPFGFTVTPRQTIDINCLKNDGVFRTMGENGATKASLSISVSVTRNAGVVNTYTKSGSVSIVPTGLSFSIPYLFKFPGGLPDYVLKYKSGTTVLSDTDNHSINTTDGQDINLNDKSKELKVGFTIANQGNLSTADDVRIVAELITSNNVIIPIYDNKMSSILSPADYTGLRTKLLAQTPSGTTGLYSGIIKIDVQGLLSTGTFSNLLEDSQGPYTLRVTIDPNFDGAHPYGLIKELNEGKSNYNIVTNYFSVGGTSPSKINVTALKINVPDSDPNGLNPNYNGEVVARVTNTTSGKVVGQGLLKNINGGYKYTIAPAEDPATNPKYKIALTIGDKVLKTVENITPSTTGVTTVDVDPGALPYMVIAPKLAGLDDSPDAMSNYSVPQGTVTVVNETCMTENSNNLDKCSFITTLVHGFAIFDPATTKSSNGTTMTTGNYKVTSAVTKFTMMSDVTSLASNPTGINCQNFNGDSTGDWLVDDFDFNDVVVNFGNTGAIGDVNHDGKVDDFDFNDVVVNFGNRADYCRYTMVGALYPNNTEGITELLTFDYNPTTPVYHEIPMSLNTKCQDVVLSESKNKSVNVCMYDDKANIDAYNMSTAMTNNLIAPLKRAIAFNNINLTGVEDIVLTPLFGESYKYYNGGSYINKTLILNSRLIQVHPDPLFYTSHALADTAIKEEVSLSSDFVKSVELGNNGQKFNGVTDHTTGMLQNNGQWAWAYLGSEFGNLWMGNVDASNKLYPKFSDSTGNSYLNGKLINPSAQNVFATQFANVCFVFGKAKYQFLTNSNTGANAMWGGTHGASMDADFEKQINLIKRMTGDIYLYDAQGNQTIATDQAIKDLYNDPNCKQ